MSDQAGHTIEIPKSGDNVSIPLQLIPGSVTFIVGPNGAGKSSLMQTIYGKIPDGEGVRVHAQRHVNLPSSKVGLTPAQYESQATTTRNNDRSPKARYSDDRIAPRINELLYKLSEADEERRDTIEELTSRQDTAALFKYDREHPKTLTACNRLLAEGTLTFEVRSRKKTFEARHDGTDWFAIELLSDGERAALLLIAEVLLATPGQSILVDEPERHLERAISAPLLSALFAQRPDCSFLVSTHDIELVSSMPEDKIILLRDVEIENNNPVSWDFDILKNSLEIPEESRRLLLGSRRKILFVEGDGGSLDLPIYSALFEKISVRSVGSCKEVEQAVDGLNAATDEHWVEAFGIVDADQKREEGLDINALKSRGIYALDVYAVESLYYGERSRRAVAEYQASIFEFDASTRLDKIKSECLAELGFEERKNDLISYRVSGLVRGKLLSLAPTRKALAAREVAAIDTYVPIPTVDEEKRYQAAIDAGDLETLIGRYKIRSSRVSGIIAQNLEFKNARAYQLMVVHLLREDESFRNDILSLFGDLRTVFGS